MGIILQTPGQASYTFDLGGPSAPRPKNLFFCIFQKAGASSSLGWEKNLGFLVKSIDRPSMQPTTEEVNQYGKKRQVYTSIKYQPVRMVIYDTADSLALQMWSAYAKHYFGDFRQTRDSFRYDVTNDDFKGADKGFGFQPQTGAAENAQFFFDTIQVYQVYGNHFVQFDLINPRITTFDPDELDYSISEVATIQMTLAYEAILYANDGRPAHISSNSTLANAFGDERLGGDVPPIDAVEGSFPNLIPRYSSIPSGLGFEAIWPDYTSPVLREYDESVSQGALNTYGQFDFGATYGSQSPEARYAQIAGNMSSDLSHAALTNPTLAAALNVTSQKRGERFAQINKMEKPYARQNSMDAAKYDVASAAVSTLGSGGGRYDPQFIGNDVKAAVMATALASGISPREHVTNGAPGEAGKSWNSADGRGLALSPQAYGLINAQRPAHSQIGFNHARKPGGE